MKHRLLEGCLNPYKHHLWRLPDIPKERQPEPYKDDNPDILVIFPLFQTSDGDTSLEHHITRSACWARRSWILFSDAVEKRIKIGFYVGDTVLNRVTQILNNNGIDIDTHVYLLEEQQFEGDPCTHLGKKLSFFNDSQFSEYEWVLQYDADMFLASPSREKNAFFSFFSDAPMIPYAVRANLRSNTPPHHNLEHHHWWHVLLHTDDPKEKIEEWLKRALELAPTNIVDAYMDDRQYITTCHGGIYAFPTKHFQSRRKVECEWIAEAGRMLQDDEATFSLWHMMGKPLACLSTETEIPFCTEIGNIYEIGEKANPTYLSHIGNIHQEWKWREDIDAL